MDLGKRIKQMRLQRSLTQKEVATFCGFTTSLLSKIENGSVVPPIGTLSKIAHCFNVKLASLLEDEAERIYAIREENIMTSDEFMDTREGKGYALLPIAELYSNKQMQPLLVHATNKEKKHPKLQHLGEEFIYIIRGSMVFSVDTEVYELREGDSLYFDATVIHGIDRVNDEVYYLDILSD